MKIKNNISIVIPILNESEAIPNLLERLKITMTENFKNNFEVILVNDGSNDTSEKILEKYEKELSWLKVINLARNYGQSTALQAGFDASNGKIIVTMDGDLQNDPSDIPKLVSILNENEHIDLVSGWRHVRNDATISRKLPSKIANFLISYITGVKLHDYGCSLKAYRSNLIGKFRLYGEMHRFIPAIAAEVGARITEIPVKHHPRKTGKSKYGIDRTGRVLLDLIWIQFSRKFMHRPIHAFGGVGLIMLSSGLFIFILLFVEKFFFGQEIGGRPLMTLGLLLTLLGTQLLAVGLIGELLIRIYHEPSGRKQYQIKEDTINIDKNQI